MTIHRVWILAILQLLVLGAAACGHPESIDQEPVVLRPSEGWSYWWGMYSPDARHVAFLGYDPDGLPRVGTVLDGRPVALSPNGVTVTDFAWMPDSTSVLIAFRENKGTGLALLRLDGQLDNLPLQDPIRDESEGMAVSPDGLRAVVADMGPGTGTVPADLALIDLGSGTSSNVTNSPDRFDEFPSFADDSTVVFISGSVSPQTPGVARDARVARLDLSSHRVRFLSPRGQVAESVAALPGSTDVFYAAGTVGAPLTLRLWSVPLASGAAREQFPLGGRHISLVPGADSLLLTLAGGPGSSGSLVRVSLT